MHYVLDTNAVIYLQRGQLAERLPVGSYGISVITEMELLAFSWLDQQKPRESPAFRQGEESGQPNGLRFWVHD